MYPLPRSILIDLIKSFNDQYLGKKRLGGLLGRYRRTGNESKHRRDARGDTEEVEHVEGEIKATSHVVACRLIEMGKFKL